MDPEVLWRKDTVFMINITVENTIQSNFKKYFTLIF